MTSKTILGPRGSEGAIVNGIEDTRWEPIIFDPFFGLNWNFSSLSSFANASKMFHDISSRVLGTIPLVVKREPEGGGEPTGLPPPFLRPILPPFFFILLYANSNIKGLQTKLYSFRSITRPGSFKTLLVRSLIFFITFSLPGPGAKGAAFRGQGAKGAGAPLLA